MIRRIAGAAALVAALALPLEAQVAGLPVYNNGVGPGVTLGLDVGFNNEDAGGGTAVGGTVSWGSGLFGLTGTLASWSPDAGDAITAVGGTGNFRVFGGPLSPVLVHLQAGAATWSVNGADFVHVPLGVGIGVVIPSPAVSLNPWIAPRLDLLKADGVLDDDWLTDFGLSAGLDIYFVGGLGLRAAYDYVSRDGARPGVFSVGANYSLGLPGL